MWGLGDSLNQPTQNVESPRATPPPQAHSGAQSAKPASARAPCGCRGAQRQGGRAQRASSSSWPELFERSAQRARSEFEGPTLPRAPQGSHATGVTAHLAPEPMPAQHRPALPRQTEPTQASKRTTAPHNPEPSSNPSRFVKPCKACIASSRACVRGRPCKTATSSMNTDQTGVRQKTWTG